MTALLLQLNENPYSDDQMTNGNDQQSLLSEQSDKFVPDFDTSESQQATLLERMPLVIEMVTNVLLNAQKIAGNNDNQPQETETDMVSNPSTMMENQSVNDDSTADAVSVEEADYKIDVSIS